MKKATVLGGGQSWLGHVCRLVARVSSKRYRQIQTDIQEGSLLGAGFSFSFFMSINSMLRYT